MKAPEKKESKHIKHSITVFCAYCKETISKDSITNDGFNNACDDWHKWIDEAPMEDLPIELEWDIEKWKRYHQAIRKLFKGKK